MEKEFIDSREVSAILGVSEATIKNWVKHKYLIPTKKEQRIEFNRTEVEKLKTKIKTGEIDRLNNRANKGKSNKSFIPSEYHLLEEEKIIKQIIDFIHSEKIDREKALFVLSIKQLSNNNLIKNDNLRAILSKEYDGFKYNSIKINILAWYSNLNNFEIGKSEIGLFDLETPPLDDFLGVIYQSLLFEGEKANQGSYYTPKSIIEKISKNYADENMKVLDPCCGTGQFLITLSNKIKDPENIYGWDTDPLAVKLCKINLLIKFKEIDFEPQIFTLNSLIDKPPTKDIQFDLIATNSPWGVHFKQEVIEQLNILYPEIKSEESFSFFLKKAIDLLKMGGIVSFILPEAILNVNIHKDIRKYILDNSRIEKICFLNRVFKNVFTNVIRLDLRKENFDKEHKIQIIIKDKEHQINQRRFMDNKDFIFNIFSTELDEQIISKVYNCPHVTLKNNSDWALGIVTGDNKKYISSDIKEGYEPIITGKEISKFFIKKPMYFIKFEPDNFQQVAPTEKYRTKEKLIYKFISNKLIFAYDNQSLLTLNSANILIPQIKDYPIKIILALLNSPISQFIYKKKFNSIKVLRSHIESLPLPTLDNLTKEKISNLVNEILIKKENETRLNEELFKLFKFDNKEIDYLLKQN